MIVSMFVSYSRRDSDLVSPIVSLVRLADANVFRDEDELKPGAQWRIEIESAIDRCTVFLLFWCSHSAQSTEVLSEFRRAHELGKRIVPVQLDATAMGEQIGQFQAIDLRPFGPHAAVPRTAFANGITMTEEEYETALTKIEEYIQYRMALSIIHWLQHEYPSH
jgi:hypothetical protein